jgi:hypothetical protein
MGQNDICTSPLGLGLGVGLGTAAGAVLIGLSTYLIFKYAGQGEDKDVRDVRDSLSVVSDTSSRFTLPEEPRYSSDLEKEQEEEEKAKLNEAREKFRQDFSKVKKINNRNQIVSATRSPTQTETKGGKLSKKRRRKNRLKKHNTLRK